MKQPHGPETPVDPSPPPYIPQCPEGVLVTVRTEAPCRAGDRVSAHFRQRQLRFVVSGQVVGWHDPDTPDLAAIARCLSRGARYEGVVESSGATEAVVRLELQQL